MFVRIYRDFGGEDNDQYDVDTLPYLEMHPDDLATAIDQRWGRRDAIDRYGSFVDTGMISALPANEAEDVNQVVLDHLIYAYMIENTRIYEIFEKVVFEYLHGEKLGFPITQGSYNWLRATEEIFYRPSSNYLIQSIVSNIRPDLRASRRNAYYRMFGMDLNHGSGGAISYPYHKPSAVNSQFVSLFEEFLSEIWLGIANIRNFAGQDPTDAPKIDDLLRLLRELLTTRKQHGNLYREEFFHVATMSWMHLTLLLDNAPIVRDLAVAAQSPAGRLRQIGERVGIPAHPKADAFFQMAEDVSWILVCIERGLLARNRNVTPQDFMPGVLGAPDGDLYDEVVNVITQWSIATGRDLKSLKTRSNAIGLPAPSPVRIAAPGTVGILAR